MSFNQIFTVGNIRGVVGYDIGQFCVDIRKNVLSLLNRWWIVTHTDIKAMGSDLRESFHRKSDRNGGFTWDEGNESVRFIWCYGAVLIEG